jgi:coenzyme F420-reducing hydrogenase gamma subunit
MRKPDIGIFGLTGCAGDQLVILNCENELLEIVGAVNIRDFVMASSANDARCDLDVAFVEGAIVTKQDADQAQKIRARSRIVVALGTCAVCGGIASPSGAAALREAIEVDVNLPGCPIEKEQLLDAVSHLLNGNAPLTPEYPVCAECRMREINCLYLEKGEICCGPLTAAGCNARCPALGVPCIGCRGPAIDANFPSALSMFERNGQSRTDIAAKLTTFAPLGAQR